MDLATLGVGFVVVALLLRYAESAVEEIPRWVSGAVAAVSAVAAAFAPSEPTGTVVLDVLLRAALGAVLAWAASEVRLGWLLASAAVVAATLLVAESPVAPLGFAAVGIAGALLAGGARSPALQALAGAFVAQTALRLEWDDRLGASLAAGGLATLLLVLPALGRVPAGARRPLRWGIAVAVLLMVVGSAVAALAAARIYEDVDDAIDTARAGIDQLSDDEAAAGEQLRQAAGLFADARDTMNAWWALPARAVPIVAQHSRAVATLADAGADLAATAADALDAADPDNVRLSDGTIDLAALRDLQGPLGDARDSLRRATDALDEIASPWLLGPVADRYDELLVEVEGRRDDVETAALAAELTPAMLGADGPRRYFLAIESPSELRAGGGVLANWGEIVADGGNLDLVRFGRTEDLNVTGSEREARTLDLPDDVQALYGDPFGMSLYWQNIAASPDLAVEADVVNQLYRQSGGEEIDGIIVADPYAIAGILRLTGPVELPGVDEPLTADNAVQFLLHDQYVLFGDAQGERVDLLGEAAEETWARLTSGPLPGPAALVDALAPAVAGGHLQIHSFHEEDRVLLEGVGIDGELPAPAADGAGFFLQNGGLNKIDYFLHRSATYAVRWDPATGRVDGTLTVAMRNDAPADGLPDSVIRFGGTVDNPSRTEDGESGGIVTIYTALPVTDVRIDGQTFEAFGRFRDGPWYVTTYQTGIPSGATQVVEVDVAGAIDGAYAFEALRQPVANTDRLDVEVTVTDGWRPVLTLGDADVAGPTVRASWGLDMPRDVVISADRP